MTQNFKKLNVWQRAHELTIKIYKFTKNYPTEETYGLTQQLRRAVISIELNITEGTCGTAKQFVKFLTISIGSCKETECCIILSKDLGYLKENEYEEAVGETRKIQGMLINLIKAIKA